MKRADHYPTNTQFQQKTYLSQDSHLCNRYTLGASLAVITAVALIIIGILAFIGISDPTGALGKLGEIFGKEGAIGLIAGGAGLLVLTVSIGFGYLYIQRSKHTSDSPQIDQTPIGSGHTGSPLRKASSHEGSNIRIGDPDDPEHTD